MSTPVILFTSTGAPVGPRAIVQFKRPPNAPDTTGNYAAGATIPNVASVVPFGGAGATNVGPPVAIAGLSISFNSQTTKTTGVFNESSNDPTVHRGDPTLNIESFIAAAGSPTLLPGDFIEINIATKLASTAAGPVVAPASRWVITANSLATTGPNKYSLSLELDRPNSDPALVEF